jgi:hypothetical protein
MGLAYEGDCRKAGAGLKASYPKVDLPFWDPSDASFMNERIVLAEKPGPLFRTMR